MTDPPTDDDRPDDQRDIARTAEHWRLTPDEVDDIESVLSATRETYDRVRDLARRAGVESNTQADTSSRQVTPVLGRDHTRAWMYRVDHEPGDVPATGALSGQRLAVKDAIAVAGVPLTFGGTVLQGYVPATDASAVERAISAGAELVGTTVCEDLCLSGSSFTSATGPVPSPVDARFSAGGSSSGAAAVLAHGEADLALGTDLGGSVRNPAAWCGIAALKPTFGAVPYTGAMSSELTMDHIGLMARTAAELVPFLTALAGPDGTDARQVGVGSIDEPSHRRHIRLGLVTEGFERPGGDPRVAAMVREAILTLQGSGATIDEVSVPLHADAAAIHMPIATEGTLATVFETSLQGANHVGSFDPALAAAFAEALRSNPSQLPSNAKSLLVATSIVRRETGGAVAALAQHMRHILRDQYDAALQERDILAMPTTPMLPHRLPERSLSPAEHRRLAFEMHDNNCALNLTGHPAVSIPCGTIDGLPVGLLLVGRHREDHALLETAIAYEERLNERK